MHRHITPLLLLLGASALALGGQTSTDKVNPGEPGTAASAEHTAPADQAESGRPWLRMAPAREIRSEFKGPERAVAALRARQAQPLSLATADFDEDGVPDVVVTHGAANGRGAVALYRGNIDALQPNEPEARRRRAEGTFVDAPFLPDVAVFDMDETGDLVGTGDFDADGHRDVVSARRGGSSLSWLRGDGKGTLGKPRRLKVSGPIVALAVGDLNRRDGLEDIAVVVDSDGTSRVLVFEGLRGALADSPEEIEVAGPVSGIALGDIDGDADTDLAVAAGSILQVIRGRDRRLSLDGARRADVPPPVVEAINLPMGVLSLVIGEFDQHPGADIALLSAARLTTLVHAADLLAEAPAARVVSSGRRTTRGAEASPGSVRLVGARLSARPGGDLILIDGGGSGVIRRQPPTGAASGLEVDLPLGPVVGALGMRLGPGPLDHLVLIRSGDAAPSILGPITTESIGVTNTNDSGAGSLRQAIEMANATVGVDTISFDMPGPGPYTIQPTTPLPVIEFPIVIDGTTEPDYAGVPVVRIDGQLAGGEHGLRIQGGLSVIKGLAITRFGSFKSAIEISIYGMNHIEGNLIGISSSETSGLGNTDGITVSSPDNTIGGTLAGTRNVISGQEGAGIVVRPGADRTTIQGNSIGLDVAGTASVSNAYGIGAGGVANLLVGGTTSGTRNVITNTFGNIFLQEMLAGTLVQGNYLGTNLAGAATVGAGQYGVLVEDANAITIGGTTPSARNVIGGQDPWGIRIDSVTLPVSANLIQGNYIGVSYDGLTPLPNTNGVEIDGGPNNIVGAFVPAGGNVISGSSQAGVRLTGAGGNDLYSNRIGTDAGGTFAVPNEDAGVLIVDSPDNRIGGATMTSANLISGNNVGIDIRGAASTSNLVEVNLIGTTIFGDLLGNTAIGVYVNAPGNMIGVKQGQGNVIAGSPHGIRIAGTIAAGNRVQGNRIGTNATGTVARPNQTGVRLSSGAHDNIVGGILAESGNLISGNLNQGVHVALAAASNTIRGNLIGTSLAGDSALPNGTGIDVDVDSDETLIGSDSAAERNVISGNVGNGVVLHGYASYVTGNFIGTTADMSVALGNGASGVLIDAPPSPSLPAGEWMVVGMDAADNPNHANVIAGNGGSGIQVVSGDIIQMRGNALFGNGGLGIDLGGDLVTLNDPPLDPDTGPNGLQNHPLLTTATTTGGSTSIGGTLESLPSATFTIDFYSSPTCDPLGYGEGRTYLGRQTVATGPAGNASFLAGLTSSVSPGEFVTATATKGSGGTSEFSPCVAVVAAPPGAVSGVAFESAIPETISWPPVAGATEYHFYVGTRATLSGLSTQAADSCEAAVIQTPGGTLPPGSNPPPGQMLWFLFTAEGIYGEGPLQPGNPLPRQLNSTGGCGDSCAHGSCDPGAALEPACTLCTSIICEQDPKCCDPVAGAWDFKCVQEMRTICRSLTCGESQGQCAHPLCDPVGGPLAPGCDTPPLPVSCTAKVCQADPHCCQQDWDEACIDKMESLCGYSCI